MLALSFFLTSPVTVNAAPSPATTITKIPGQSDGLTPQQIEHIGRLEETLKKARNGEAEADALYQLGQYHFSIGEAKKAESYFMSSKVAEDKLKRPEQALQVRIALAHLMMSEKRSEAALQMYKDALDVANKNKNSEQIAECSR